MKTQLFLLILTVATLCFRAVAVPVGPQYAITDLGLLPAPKYGHVDQGAFALNDAGQAVGGDTHAFLWSSGRKMDIGGLPLENAEDFAYSVAYGINNRGQIVGTSGSFGPIFMSGLQFARGLLYENGKLRQLTQRNTSFEPYAINDKGQIVGLDAYRGFLYENGRVIELGTLSRVPVGNRSTAQAVSNSGQIVGWSTVNAGTSGPPYGEVGRYIKQHGKWVMEEVREPTRTYFTHACLWRVSGKAVRQRDLGTLPGWANSYAYGVSDQVEVTGSVSNAPDSAYGIQPDFPSLAFLWHQGKMISLGTLPGCRSSEAFGINNAGAVVGQSDGKAFLWREGKMRDLNALIPADAGWVLTEARAVNNKGQIAGQGHFHGLPHAFLLTPR